MQLTLLLHSNKHNAELYPSLTQQKLEISVSPVILSIDGKEKKSIWAFSVRKLNTT